MLQSIVTAIIFTQTDSKINNNYHYNNDINSNNYTSNNTSTTHNLLRAKSFTKILIPIVNNDRNSNINHYISSKNILINKNKNKNNSDTVISTLTVTTSGSTYNLNMYDVSQPAPLEIITNNNNNNISNIIINNINHNLRNIRNISNNISHNNISRNVTHLFVSNNDFGQFRTQRSGFITPIILMIEMIFI